MSPAPATPRLGSLPPAALAWKAATLTERLAAVGHETDAGAAAAGLERWARAFAEGDMSALRRRLAWDGIDPATASRAMADAPPPGFSAPWVREVPEVLRQLQECAASIGGPSWPKEVASLAGAPEPPFLEAWLPFVRLARERLACRLEGAERLSSNATGAFERHLARQLAAAGELALFEDFRARRGPLPGAGSAAYDAYIESLLRERYAEILEAYPVLARHLVQIVDDWVADTGDFADRLTVDRKDIEEAFGGAIGEISRVIPGLSDRHAGGRTVCFVEFASGLRLAYKPREVQLERAYDEWLDWLRARGLEAVPRGLRVLDRGVYGWVEWIDQHEFGSVGEVEAYFRGAGTIACLAYLLGGADLHGENLVAAKGGPVLVDAEMLLQPTRGGMGSRWKDAPLRRPASGSRSHDDTDGAGEESCLSPGLVSLVVFDGAGRPFDIGGLQPAPERESTIARRRWSGLRSDSIGYDPDRQVRPRLANDVRLHGVLQEPWRFADEVCAGFANAYRFCQAQRGALLGSEGALARFDRCPTRVLFRKSDQYAALQYILAAPRYQRSGVDRSLAIEMLGRVFRHDREIPRLWPLVRAERDVLDRLDIPRLTIAACATTIAARDAGRIEDYFARSGMDAARSRLAAMSDDDLASQLDQLRAALGRREGVGPQGRHVQASADPKDVALIEAAEAVGVTLIERATRRSDGTLVWPAVGSRADMYAGAGGIAVFLAALSAVVADERWRALARDALAGLHLQASAAGHPPTASALGASGAGSAAYAVALAGRLLGDEAAVARALALAGTISRAEIDDDSVLDVEGGSAGTLLTLLALPGAMNDAAAYGAARACASRLLATQVPCGPDAGAWPAGHDGRARTGFAHGASGMACALARWFEQERSPEVAEAIRRAWAFERRVFEESGGAWPATAADGSRVVMAAWCHGAPGVALARACAPADLGDDRLHGEIQTALESTAAAPAGRLDHLCCGNLGRAEVLLTAGRLTRSGPAALRGRVIASAVARQIVRDGRLGMRGQGFAHGATAVGFFPGLSGIGYQLLRTAAPDRLPSVLAFQAVQA